MRYDRAGGGRRSILAIVCLTVLTLSAAGCSSTNEASTTSSSGPVASADGSAPTGRGPGATAGSSDRGDATGDAAVSEASANAPGAKQRSSGVDAPLPAGSNRAPIEVGVLYAVNDAAESAGIDNGDTIAPSDVVRAYVESFNASCGLGGRRIEPVYANLNSA